MGNVLDFKTCTTEYEDGSKFHGQCERGKFNGHGTMQWTRKERTYAKHPGLIASGRDILRAVMTVQEAKAKASKLEGCKGFCYLGQNTGEPTEIIFKDTWDLDKQSNRWTSYEVQEMTVESDSFSGYYLDGLMHGQGTYVYADKSRYMGQYRCNLREGYGVFTFNDGSLYEGEWKADKPHGNGRVIYPGGEIVDTNFINGEQDMGEAILKRSEMDLGANPLKSLQNKSEESKRLALGYGTGAATAATSKFGPPKPPAMQALVSPFENPAMTDVDRVQALTDVHGMSKASQMTLPTLPALAPLPAIEQHPQQLALPGGPSPLALPPGPPALENSAPPPPGFAALTNGATLLPPGPAALTNGATVPPPPPPLMSGLPAIPPTSQHPDARRLPMLPPTAPLSIGNVPPPPPPRPFGANPGGGKKLSAIPKPPNAVPRPPNAAPRPPPRF